MANQSGSNTDAGDARREELSALVDGESTADAVQRMCAAWRDEPSARDDWHAFQLIGDVMRSEDLASAAAHDARFLRDFRARMLTEPVVLAPQPQAGRVSVRRSNGSSWRMSTAVAAGFVVVAGTLLVTQIPRPAAVDAVPMATVAPADTAVVPVSVTAPAQVAAWAPPAEANPAVTELVFDGQVIRDPRLDRYLLAHKQFSGSSVLGAPSGFLRNAAAEVPVH